MGLNQMRKGVDRLINVDRGIGTVTRKIMADNGRDKLIPTGEVSTHQLYCRVLTQSDGIQPAKQWAGGLTIDQSPYVLAVYDANLKQGDTLEWRGSRYKVGAVSRPQFDGGATCTQAPLVEVSSPQCCAAAIGAVRLRPPQDAA